MEIHVTKRGSVNNVLGNKRLLAHGACLLAHVPHPTHPTLYSKIIVALILPISTLPLLLSFISYGVGGSAAHINIYIYIYIYICTYDQRIM